jgi:enoyl-CoA hydratase/carnithine racemase
MSSMDSSVLIERRGCALWVILNRPEAFNSLTPAMVRGLDSALDRIDADSSVRALVLTGNGRSFCAGADLKAVLAEATGGSDPSLAFRRYLEHARRVFERLEKLRVPTIAAINGVALAGGLELVLLCDIAIAAESAKLGEGHAKFGQLPGGGGSARLPRRIGSSRAKYMMFTGEMIPASQALSWGLVNQVAADSEFNEAVERVLNSITEKSPIGLQRMKQLADAAMDQPLVLACDQEILMSELHTLSHDRNEGLAAFAEKRAPIYVGR